jgi:HSP20 family molecular chaperone IbpA
MANQKLSPDLRAYYDKDDEKLKIEVELPGVKKKDIKFKLRDDSFSIHAPVDNYEYTGTYLIWSPVIPYKAKATYADNLLTVTIPYKQSFDGAVKVKIA